MASHGGFSCDPRTEWLTEVDEDRAMTVLVDFTFTDPKGTAWTAPADSRVNGASIPRALWTVVGSPYTGDYRRASIVHDVACVAAGGDTTKRRAADRMFFHACRAGGCTIWQATLLYLGVRVGAVAPDVPKWAGAVAEQRSGPRMTRTEQEQALERDFGNLAQKVLGAGETDDPDEIEGRADAALATMIGVGVQQG
jgi:hypothetical protein